MEDRNVLLEMAQEKQRKINQAMTDFLGHEPSEENKRAFIVMHKLSESLVYFHEELIAVVRNEVTDDDGLHA